MSSGRIIGLEEVMSKFRTVSTATLNNVETHLGRFAAEREIELKETRPWQDRTGNARRSLMGRVQRSPRIISVVISIGVYYGVFLELAHGGRYRVIEPVRDSNRRSFMQSLQGALRR